MKTVLSLSVLSRTLGSDKEGLLPVLPTGAHTCFLGALKSHPQLIVALDGDPLKESMIRVRHSKTTGAIHLVVESLSLTDKGRGQAYQPRRTSPMSTTDPISAPERIVFDSDFVIGWTVVQPPMSPHVQQPSYPEQSDGRADKIAGDVPDTALASLASGGTDDTTNDHSYDSQQDRDLTILSTEDKKILDRIASLGLTQSLQSTKPRSPTKRTGPDTHPTDQPAKRPRLFHAPTGSCTSLFSDGNDNTVIVQPPFTDASPQSKTTTTATLASPKPPTTTPQATTTTTTTTPLLCPFALRNPEKYLSCLYRDPPGSINALRDHLVRRHARPPYCSVCGDTFPTHGECDAHVVLRGCELSAAPPVVEGLEAGEVRVLEYWTSAHEGKGVWGEYKEVWEVVFPGVPVPDLSGGVGGVWRRAGEVRAWWGVNGGRVMRDFLDGKKVGQERLEMMRYGVLERMIRMLVEDEGSNNGDY